MARIAYITKKFGEDRLNMIAQADEIMQEYHEQGFSLTLRQLYYQFVSRGMLPNHQKNYARLGDVVNDARMAGMLDWNQIEDRTRGIESLSKWDSPSSIMDAVAAQYRIDLWDGQDVRPEVWIEKEALAGVVAPTCDEHRVDYLACRGYTSASETWRAAQRIVRRYKVTRQRTLILHLGDHDPSGIDMTRDNRERLELMCRYHLGIVPFELKRIALNMDQIEELNPPPNPAKSTDSRFQGYQDKFGDESWELDALDPNAIADLIDGEIDLVKDDAAWAAKLEQEEDEKKSLALVSARFDEAVTYLKEND